MFPPTHSTSRVSWKHWVPGPRTTHWTPLCWQPYGQLRKPPHRVPLRTTLKSQPNSVFFLGGGKKYKKLTCVATQYTVTILLFPGPSLSYCNLTSCPIYVNPVHRRLRPRAYRWDGYFQNWLRLLPWGFGIIIMFFSHPMIDFMKYELPSGHVFHKRLQTGLLMSFTMQVKTTCKYRTQSSIFKTKTPKTPLRLGLGKWVNQFFQVRFPSIMT